MGSVVISHCSLRLGDDSVVFIMTEDVHIHSGVVGSKTDTIKHVYVLDGNSTLDFKILLEISILGSLGRLCSSLCTYMYLYAAPKTKTTPLISAKLITHNKLEH